MAVKSAPLETRILQAALFLSKIDLSDKLQVAADIRNAVKGIFDGNPTILPIPDDAPSDFPRVILNSKDAVFSCNVTPERIDFIYDKSKVPTNGQGSNGTDKVFLNHVKNLTGSVLENLNGRIYRVALIMKFKYKPEDGATVLLQQKITKELSDGAKELQLHRLKIVEVESFKSNHWVRFISQDGGTEKEFLLIISDLNTVRTEKYQFTQADIESFFKSALKITRETIENLL